MDNIKNVVAKNLRYYRKNANLNQKELAQQLGVRSTSVSSWENGVNSVDLDTLYKVCKIIGIDITEVLGKYAKASTSNIPTNDFDIIRKYNQLNESDKTIVDFIFNRPSNNTCTITHDTNTESDWCTEDGINSISDDE